MEKIRRYRRVRALEARKVERKIGPAVVCLAIFTVMSWGFLSSLRSDTNRIQGQLSEVIQQIGFINEELRELERQITAQSSPSVVYSYTIKKMGMSQVHLAGTIHIMDSLSGTMAASLPDATFQRR